MRRFEEDWTKCVNELTAALIAIMAHERVRATMVDTIEERQSLASGQELHAWQILSLKVRTMEPRAKEKQLTIEIIIDEVRNHLRDSIDWPYF